MKNLKQLKKNSGFTIVELLIGIGVIVGFLAFVYGIYSRISTSNHANTLIGDLTMFQTKIHEVYANEPTGYTGMKTEDIIKSKAYPGDLGASATALNSSFAGAVTVDGKTANTFDIVYANVPNGVCKAALGKLVSSGEFVTIAVGTGTTTPGADKASVETACGSSGPVKMTFTSN
ncbi:MAG: type 4 pilus major pilin [Burkholderiales bacterium]|nr:type 4 pilus major pilin [Burkholderiales bacterium]